jgi:hypothetical protein
MQSTTKRRPLVWATRISLVEFNVPAMQATVGGTYNTPVPTMCPDGNGGFMVDDSAQHTDQGNPPS